MSPAVELVDLVTEDGLHLPGAFYDPPARTASGVDAFVLVHGSMGSFTSSVIRGVAERLVAAGYPVLTFSNRGRDIVWYQSGIPGFFGNAYELIDGCIPDIRAALDWLEERGLTRIGLFGRSLGGSKVVYYQSVTEDPRVATVLSIAPSALSGSVNREIGARGPDFAAQVEEAGRLVAEGKGHQLLWVPFLGMGDVPMSAATMWDAVGPEERYALLTHGPRLRVPLLLLRGDADANLEVVAGSDRLAQTLAGRPSVRSVLVPGGNHSLTGKEDEGVRAMLDWVENLPAA